MASHQWITEFPAAITVCDTNGIIIEMNKHSVETFREDGGEKLIGTNVLDCHPLPARIKLMELLQSGKPNVYTIEKQGAKKFIYQSPWFENGLYKGFVELSLPIPFELPHFDRNK
ncbi:MAG: diguanylate cyclase [bacterium]